MQFAQGAYRGHSFKPFLKGLGTGLAAAAVNFGIEWVANGYEDDKFKSITDAFKEMKLDNEREQQGINILSKLQ